MRHARSPLPAPPAPTVRQAPRTLGDLADAIAATLAVRPDFAWRTVPPDQLVNGRYVVDHRDATVYLSRDIPEGAGILDTLIDALAELRNGRTTQIGGLATVIPLCRDRPTRRTG